MAATEQNLDIFVKRIRAVETRIDALTSRAAAGLAKEPNILPYAFIELQETLEETRSQRKLASGPR